MTGAAPARAERALFSKAGRPVSAALGLTVAALTSAIMLSGCTGGPEDGSDRTGAEERVVASVPVGELGGLDGALRTGQEIHVFIDTPDIGWTVTSSAPDVAEVVEEDPDANPRIVRIVASAAGEAGVDFAGSDEDAHDSIAIEVAE